MRLSIISKLLSLAPLTLLGTVACTDPDPDPIPPQPPVDTVHQFSPGAQFANLTAAQRTRAVIAASGADAEDAIQRASRFTGPPEDLPCPSIVRVGGDVAVTTNCSIGYTRYEGGFVVSYPQGDAAMEIRFANFTVSDGSGTVALDGRVASRAGRIVSALTTTRDGVPVYTQATWEVDAQAYTALPDAKIDMFALGSAAVEGSWNFDRLEREGLIELQGQDQLAATVGPACFDLTVADAAAGQACTPLLAPR